MPSRIEFNCPVCFGMILAPASLEGNKAPCPKCGVQVNRWQLARKAKPCVQPPRPAQPSPQAQQASPSAKRAIHRRKRFLAVASAAILLATAGGFGAFTFCSQHPEIVFHTQSDYVSGTDSSAPKVQEQSVSNIPSLNQSPVNLPNVVPTKEPQILSVSPFPALPDNPATAVPAKQSEAIPVSKPPAPSPRPAKAAPAKQSEAIPANPPPAPPATTVPARQSETIPVSKPPAPAKAPAAKKITLPPLNEKVRDFATNKMEKQVGNGECWTLAYEALNAAKAKRPGRDGLSIYQFGMPVDLKAVVPGDVLQFEDVNFKHTDPDGRWYSNSFPHHTAIVSSLSGTKLTMFHQNYSGDRTVKLITLDLKDRLPGGSLKAYRPAPR